MFRSQLIPELWLRICFDLPPEDIASMVRLSRNIKNITRSHALLWQNLWKYKFEQHFPHRLAALEKQGKIDWLGEFKKAYKDEYNTIPKKKRRIFSLIKEGDVTRLRELHRQGKFLLDDVDLTDKAGTSCIYWAKKNKNQNMLDFFYEVTQKEVEKVEDSRKYKKLLQSAILFNQDYSLIKKLLGKVRNINELYRDTGYNFLHLAAHEGRADVVQLLIDTGADVNIFSDIDKNYTEVNDGVTAIMFALGKGHKDVVEILLKHNANISFATPALSPHFSELFNIASSGDTPLYAAIRTGNVEIVEAILKRAMSFRAAKANPVQAMNLAAYLGFAEVMAVLIRYGANVDTPDNNGCTPLFYAAEYGHKEAVELLLQHNAQVDVKLRRVDNRQYDLGIQENDTALIAALRVKQPDIALAILRKIKDPQVNDYMYTQSFILAVGYGFADVVSELIKMGVDVNTRVESGATPLLLAISYNHKNIVDLLLEHNPNPTFSLKSYEYYPQLAPGDTLLMAAVKMDRLDIAISLLNKIPYPAADQLAAFKYALDKKKSDFVKAFIKHGFDPGIYYQSKNKKASKTNGVIEPNNSFLNAIRLHQFDVAQGILSNILNKNDSHSINPEDLEAALGKAVRYGQVELVGLLIQAGVNVNAQTPNGATALLFAVENNHKNIAEILLQYGAKINIPLHTNHDYHQQFGVAAGDNALIAAAKLDRFEIVELLLSKLLDNRPDTGDYSDGQGATLDIAGQDSKEQISRKDLEKLLRWAAQTGQANIVRQLLQLGVEINAQSSCGATALLYAVEHGHENVVDILLENEDLIDTALSRKHEYHAQFQVMPGDTTLHVAAKLDRTNIVVKLLNSHNHRNSMERLNANDQTPEQVSQKNTPCGARFQLFNLWHKIKDQETSRQRKTMSFFGQTLFVSASAQEIKDATIALKAVVFDGADKATLDDHQVALRSSSLKSLYRNLRIK